MGRTDTARDGIDMTPPSPFGTNSGQATVSFARPGVNSVKQVTVNQGATISDAMASGEVTLREDKEGIAIKGSNTEADGTVKSLTDPVEDGVVYFIMPGIQSN